MYKILLPLVLCLTLSSSAQSVNFEAVRVNPATRGELSGYELESRLTVHGLNGKELALCVVFYDNSGQPLKDLDGQYRSTNGMVASHFTFVASSDNTLLDSRDNSSFAIFIPKEQFHLTTSQGLRAQMSVVSLPDGTNVGESNMATFKFTTE